MFIKEFTVDTWYTRKSKLGVEHSYKRSKTIVVFRCDECNEEFTRDRGSVDPKRLSNNYFHVCENCDAKRFAQRKGVERKQVWNLHASSDLPIGKL
jgi:DNA-directed RNA polymerase subunit RPC12/RpoP